MTIREDQPPAGLRAHTSGQANVTSGVPGPYGGPGQQQLSCPATSTCYVPGLLDQAGARAIADGLNIELSFDVVLSTFGVMFAPDQDRAASSPGRNHCSPTEATDFCNKIGTEQMRVKQRSGRPVRRILAIASSTLAAICATSRSSAPLARSRSGDAMLVAGSSPSMTDEVWRLSGGAVAGRWRRTGGCCASSCGLMRKWLAREAGQSADPAFRPEAFGNLNGIASVLAPPCGFVPTPMKRPMMQPAERHCELVAHPPAEGGGLRKADVVGIRRVPTAKQAPLRGDELEVPTIAVAARFAEGQQALVDRGPVIRLTRFRG